MRAICCIVGCLAAVIGWAQPQYEVVNLTKMFGEDFTAMDINNSGVIAGSMFIDFQTTQACVVQNGKLTMLPMYQGKHDWYPRAINDNGDVLGIGTIDGVYHTYLYSNGKVIDTGLTGTMSHAPGSGLNNGRTIVGTFSGGPAQAFTWSNGVTTILSPLSIGDSGAGAISDAGVVVGTSQVGGVGSDFHATKWVNGKIVDIHPGWSDRATAVAVNEKGDIAGLGFAITGGQHGILWQGGKIIQLPNLGSGQSQAYDINESSQVVGWATTAGGPDEGVLWTDGKVFRLDDLILGGSGYQLVQNAFAINDDAQILLTGFTGSAIDQILLNPVPELDPAIVLGAGVGVLTISRRRWRGKSNS
jgi:probable HAF family extracellular repeat protein